MKNIAKIFWAVCAMAIWSCTKDNLGNLECGTIPMVEVSFEVDTPLVEVDTKVSHQADGTTHNFAWEVGDQFSMFGIMCPVGADNQYVTSGINSFECVNCSANKFTFGETNKFKGFVPDIKTMYGDKAKMLECCIFPAATCEVDETLSSFEEVKKSDGTYMTNTRLVLKPKGLTIPNVQDGTGWPYCIFFSRTAFMSTWLNPVGQPMTFKLSNVVLKLNIESGKNISQLVLRTDGPFLVGDVTAITCENRFDTCSGKMTIRNGCAQTTLTISNGGILPNELYLAVRALSKDKTYTFTFTAEDGTTCVKQMTPKVAHTESIVPLKPLIIKSEDWQ